MYQYQEYFKYFKECQDCGITSLIFKALTMLGSLTSGIRGKVGEANRSLVKI